MCLQTSSRIVCIAFMVSILNSCMVILKWAALSGGLCRQEFARSNLSRFGQRTGQGPAVKAVCNHGFRISILTVAAPAKSVGGHGFEPARGEETAPARAEAICGGVVP